MTLILAIACDDGVVIGSDSAFSDTQIGAKHPGEKIKRIGEHSILYGASGSVGLQQKIDVDLQAVKLRLAQTALKQIRNAIKGSVVPLQKKELDDHVPLRVPGYLGPPGVGLLIVGILDKRPWILEIEPTGEDTLYDETMGSFAAIGSGKRWAHAIFRPHLHAERDLHKGKVLAYRVIEDSISLAAAYLAEPIHLYTITLDGTVEHLDRSAMRDLHVFCNLWRELEREALGKALSPPVDKAESSIPTPPATPNP